jgi:hypothetical protein
MIIIIIIEKIQKRSYDKHISITIYSKLYSKLKKMSKRELFGLSCSLI